MSRLHATSRFRRAASALATAFVLCVLPGCGGGGGGEDDPAAQARTLDQFGYLSAAGQYVYGLNSIDRLALRDVPADADLGRWAMAHDGSSYWLITLGRASSTTVHPFRFDGSGYSYVGAPTQLTGAPADADFSSVAMLHNGASFRIYLRSASTPTTIHQFAAASMGVPFVYGGGPAIANLGTTGVPTDADLGRWTMFFDGTTYRQAIGRRGNPDVLYQFGWNGSSYAHAHASRDVVTVVGAPTDTFPNQAKILHDGSGFRLYRLAP